MSIPAIQREVIINGIKKLSGNVGQNVMRGGWVRQRAMGAVQRQLPWALAGSAIGSVVGGGQAWMQGRDPIRGAMGGAVRGAGYGFAMGMGYEGYLGARGAYKAGRAGYLKSLRNGTRYGGDEIAARWAKGWVGGQASYMSRFSPRIASPRATSRMSSMTSEAIPGWVDVMMNPTSMRDVSRSQYNTTMRNFGRQFNASMARGGNAIRRANHAQSVRQFYRYGGG